MNPLALLILIPLLLAALGWAKRVYPRRSMMWWALLPQNHVAASLPIQHVPDLTQSVDDFATGNDRQWTHGVTSTTSSVMDGGTGSP